MAALFPPYCRLVRPIVWLVILPAGGCIGSIRTGHIFRGPLLPFILLKVRTALHMSTSQVRPWCISHIFGTSFASE
ncbi:protein of unknown function [Azospirillum lipoferum 4B]|uniref:Uncharacterized protein n=1 Tax=Azospirillum lipoferum (strain 4B) TaxID=862719 RepID=G7Z909_AZOL4|nr:protein of unknown function [Azospirillum lipoferum 4B]